MYIVSNIFIKRFVLLLLKHVFKNIKFLIYDYVVKYIVETYYVKTYRVLSIFVKILLCFEYINQYIVLLLH